MTLALAGLALAFVESLELGSEDRAAIGAIAVVLSPLGAALGNVALKRRGASLDAIVLNGWGMLIGGALLLAGLGRERGLGRGGVEREGDRLDPLPRRRSAPPSRS